MLKRRRKSAVEDEPLPTGKIERYYGRKWLGNYDSPSRIIFYMNEEDNPEINLITSRTLDEYHAPVIDIDFEAKLVPSITDGHYHLYLDKRITWEQAEKLLDVLAEIGLVEQAWVNSAKVAQAMLVRTPTAILKEAFGADDD